MSEQTETTEGKPETDKKPVNAAAVATLMKEWQALSDVAEAKERELAEAKAAASAQIAKVVAELGTPRPITWRGKELTPMRRKDGPWTFRGQNKRESLQLDA